MCHVCQAVFTPFVTDDVIYPFVSSLTVFLGSVVSQPPFNSFTFNGLGSVFKGLFVSFLQRCLSLSSLSVLVGSPSRGGDVTLYV